ncbi:lysylphosphatidylglycerol synthase transmembrane domain-containing protein [Variovorax sp. PAMC 28711]|uniref:lysylphosphatidylglycerol synthase transmembrane domain-containing protein n=1 Tax=Variovorax sp. PAMC 28711 TaxID=1795631 RepID=UPI000AF40394|nr:lysylphosphatidylglycerol synthase transmembrane domain-containing protein [Variovorax sp. PAMC 28711]
MYQLLRWLILFVLLGAALSLGGMVWSGWDEVTSALVRLSWLLLVGAAFVASTAHVIRFVRWHVALRCLGNSVPPGINFAIYLSGLALTTSPGKLGETVRSLFLLPMGVPLSKSLGAFLADRLSDVLGVCLLGAVAGLLVRCSLNFVGVVMGVVLGGSFALCHLVRSPLMFGRATAVASRWGFAPGRVVVEALGQWAQLWTLRNAALFTLLAALAFGIQAAVFTVLCTGVSLSLQPATAVEIFVNATLLGAASMVPGGLGTMEASLVFQLMVQGAKKGDAVAIAIATRCVTLWCGVLIGLISFAGVGLRMKPTKRMGSPLLCKGADTSLK